jgi:hypothetical protein
VLNASSGSIRAAFLGITDRLADVNHRADTTAEILRPINDGDQR